MLYSGIIRKLHPFEQSIVNTDKSVFEYSNLVFLDLAKNNIGDKGCIALSEKLPRLRVKILSKELRF